MKEYLKEQNMRRENDPVSTTLDVGLNNNQLELPGQSPNGSEDTENENFWVTDGVGLSANYEWCCESGSSVDDPEESSSEYGLGWEEDNRPNNWKNEKSDEKTASSDWQDTKKTISHEKISTVNETSSDLGYFWSNAERDDNEFNNNGAAVQHRTIAGDSVNQLDICKNEEKIFYEKPKLNIQTVTYLYDSVLPPTVKCMNYVNSIKVSESLENILTPEEKVVSSLTPDESKIPEIVQNLIVEEKQEEEEEEEEEKREFLTKEIPLNREEIINDWPIVNDESLEVDIDVEIVELTKSVKDIIQFPEIEEITETLNVTKDEIVEQQINENLTNIEQIDLIREAKELTIENRSKTCDIKKLTKISDITLDKNIESCSSDNETLYENYYEDNNPVCNNNYSKIEEIDLLSSIGRDIGVDLEKYVQTVPDVVAAMETVKQSTRSSIRSFIKDAKIQPDTNKIVEQKQQQQHDIMPDISSADTRKKEKMARNQARRRQPTSHTSNGSTRRPDKRRADHIVDGGPGGFDVYNIETAMPKIDLDAIESHLRAAREEERRRRNDREEIRRRLAMGPDAEDLRAERGRKPSLQSRLQSGMNLQICFMNETTSDNESPSSENDVTSPGHVVSSSFSKLQQQQKHSHQLASRPQILSLPSLRVETGGCASMTSSSSTSMGPVLDEADFFARQARLQTEARMALAQAKEMAHMQMEVERQRLKQSPITEMVRSSLEKVGVQLGEDRRRLSRVLLTELNVAQLQVVANDLHARIAMLNEALVEGLLRRDDLHMEQDSMLVDVEDLTRYLGAKQEQTLKKRPSSRNIMHQHQQQSSTKQQQNLPTTSKIRDNQGTIMSKTSLTREKMIKCLSTRRAA